MLREAVLLALREIRRNLMRSALTMLGVVIGVAAVITMVTLGSGATAQVTRDIARLGTNLLDVRPGRGPRGPGGARVASTPFELADAEAISVQVTGLEAVAPTAARAVQAIVGNENWPTTATGADNAFFAVRDWGLGDGRAFTDSELRSGAAVCVLGATVRRELFGAQDPLGSIVRLGRLPCEVVGVLQAKGQSGFGIDQDDVVVLPLRAVQRRLTGNRDVSAILVSVREGTPSERVRADIEGLLRERRGIGIGEEDDFFVRDMEELVSALTGTTRVLTTLLGAVAAVSLLVGGIGIMNIMLVSVTERTREIGIRLAVGAREREVLAQFLVEAIVLSSCGGAVGIALGVGGSAIVTPLLRVPFVFEPGIVALAAVFSAAVGIAFGYFPARRAARLDPIEALRYE